MTEAQKHQMMLKEAFPTLDDAVIRAVLTASGGKIDPAFNALLGKSAFAFFSCRKYQLTDA